VIEHFNLEQMLTRLVALLHRAEELALTYPQQSVSAEEGRAAAAAAVTLARQHALAETLFTMQSSDWRLSQMGQSQRAWHRLAGVFKRRLLQPLYEWGLGLGFEWLMPAKNGLYQIIRRWMGRKV
jgi:hypothetical protein